METYVTGAMVEEDYIQTIFKSRLWVAKTPFVNINRVLIGGHHIITKKHHGDH